MDKVELYIIIDRLLYRLYTQYTRCILGDGRWGTLADELAQLLCLHTSRRIHLGYSSLYTVTLDLESGYPHGQLNKFVIRMGYVP